MLLLIYMEVDRQSTYFVSNKNIVSSLMRSNRYCMLSQCEFNRLSYYEFLMMSYKLLVRQKFKLTLRQT